jgi:hypothetical protein
MMLARMRLQVVAKTTQQPSSGPRVLLGQVLYQFGSCAGKGGVTLDQQLASFAFFRKNLWFYQGADHNRVSRSQFFLKNLRFSQGGQGLTTGVVAPRDLRENLRFYQGVDHKRVCRPRYFPKNLWFYQGGAPLLVGFSANFTDTKRFFARSHCE